MLSSHAQMEGGIVAKHGSEGTSSLMLGRVANMVWVGTSSDRASKQLKRVRQTRDILLSQSLFLSRTRNFDQSGCGVALDKGSHHGGLP